MKTASKLAALLLALLMALPMTNAFAQASASDALVYAAAPFDRMFNPFFAVAEGDREVVSLFTGTLLATDRGGGVVRGGIEGETTAYNGVEYTYYAMGDAEVVINDDGSVDYNLNMRDDIMFSDGHPADIDDVIFGIYVMADPTYDGGSTLYAQPIEGLSDYCDSEAPLYRLMADAGRDNADFSKWDEATQTAFWADVDAAGAALAQEIVDYVCANYLTEDYAPTIGKTVEEIQADPQLQLQFGMTIWGFGNAYAEGADVSAFWAALETAYGGAFAAAEAESVGSALTDLIPDFDAKYGASVSADDGSVPSIRGVIRTSDYSLTIHMTEYDPASLYSLNLCVAPLHHYGDESLYDYENNSFGFKKGDLSGVRAKTGEPLGCGPYVVESCADNAVTLKANPCYFKGEPAVKTLLLRECAAEEERIAGIVNGSFDLARSSLSADAVQALRAANSNGELTGDALAAILIDYRGYGCLGINADLVNVGGAGNAGSAESRNLRKAFMTLFSVYRDAAIRSYYGERAAVIQYPISNASWAAPRPDDEGYQPCYSVDVDGNPIYTAEMDEEQRCNAALSAAIGYLKAAGYVWDESASAFTAAPDGASLRYEVMIPGQGKQDHPAYSMAAAAAEQLAKIGITLQVNDVDATTWKSALDTNTAQMWAAARQSAPDPDMYETYHSRNARGMNTGGNHCQIMDEELDALILSGRASADAEYRKAVCKQAMEIVLDWGCELPLYQRKDCVVASAVRVDVDTLPKDMTPYYGWSAEIETLAMK